MADPRTYTISIRWAGNPDTETEVWLAEVAVFGSGAMVHGATRQIALTNAEQMVVTLIAAYQDQGLSVPEDAGGF